MHSRTLFLSVLTAITFPTAASAQLVDLILKDWTPPTKLVAGQTVVVPITVRNGGFQQAPSVRGRFQVLGNGTTTVLSTFDVPALDNNREWSSNQRFAVPADLPFAGRGTLYCDIDYDDRIREIREDNNGRSRRLDAEQRADLTVGNLRVSTQRWLRGQNYSFSASIRNVGGIDSGAFTLGIYLSDNSTITRSDTLLASSTFTNVRAGSANSKRFTVSIPSSWPYGTCTIGYYVDSARVVQEADENNNAFGTTGLCAIDGDYQSFGAGCGRSKHAVPVHSGNIQPTTGAIARLELANAPANRGAILMLGGSKTIWGNLQLPIDLAPFGASGCKLLVSPDATLTTTTTATGTGAIQVLLPTGLEGASFHTQFFVLDSANALGVIASNGVTTRIGN